MIGHNIWKFLTVLGKRTENLGYALSNPDYLKLRTTGGSKDLYKLLNKSWFPKQNIRTVFDIGANEGQFIKSILALLPDVSVYAFEPQSQCVQILEKAHWGGAKIKILPVALGDRKGTLPLHIARFSPASSLLSPAPSQLTEYPDIDTEKSIDVEVDTLDRFLSAIDTQPQFLLKIDVQGFEAKVLAGARETLKKTAVIVCEVNMINLYEGQANFAQILSITSDCGFDLVDIGGQIYSAASGELLYIDVAFKRRDV